MRVYFEKPRTTVGWKGFINDPHLDETFDMNEGIRLARKLLREINEIGVPCGTEFLDLISPQYIADLIAWGAIGARTTESQSHRQLASGLSCPVGFKNGTDGNVRIAVDAIKAANSRHYFISVTKSGHVAVFKTAGNEDCHVILRGGKTPNYDCASIDAACKDLAAAGLRQQLMVDFPQANEPGSVPGRTDDLRISAIRALIAPQLLTEELPIDSASLATVTNARQAVHRVLHGADDRLVAVVGPCSIHDAGAAMEYASRL